MRTLLTVLLLWFINVAPRPGSVTDSFRYERAVTAAVPGPGSTACAMLDAEVYAHAAASLKDLRLYRQTFLGAEETPYAITLSESAEAESEAATLRNPGERGGAVVFDLAMPRRPYTEVLLDLDARNFIASAEVSGSQGEGKASTHLGTFTLFDLTSQHLGRGTSLPLQESTFSVLHIVLRFSAAPGTSGPPPGMAAVRGATVPPSREAQTLYTVVAEAANIAQQGKETVAHFALPAHVPVERVSIVVPPDFAGNFSRDVVVTAHTVADEEDERLSGLVEQVRLERAGREVRQEQLGFAATLGANLQADATVEVRIQNGDDPPLPLRAVQLKMRERRLCFPATPAARLTLFYGDPARDTPHYDFARTFSPSAHVLPATLSGESLNPQYVAPVLLDRTIQERHPELLWVTLLGVVCVLAVVAIHSAKRMPG